MQKRLLKEQGVLDTDSRAIAAGVDHPIIMNPPSAGATQGLKGQFGTDENPQGSPHPQTIRTIEVINNLEKAVRMIDVASSKLERLNDGALASTADSIRDLHKLMIEYISDLKDQAAKYISKNRPGEFDEAQKMLRRTK